MNRASRRRQDAAERRGRAKQHSTMRRFFDEAAGIELEWQDLPRKPPFPSPTRELGRMGGETADQVNTDRNFSLSLRSW
jgi:hypothetical protein